MGNDCKCYFQLYFANLSTDSYFKHLIVGVYSILSGLVQADNLKSRSNAREQPDDQISAQTFTYRELVAATNDFRPESFIGEGGFGRVYQGKLKSTGQVKSTFLIYAIYLRKNQI